MGTKSINGGGGEIVQVQGGHIVRATGRKDRHSKVYTAKGPRDRRVRLSAHTAIQFYDVQDRLGYDRPSKAVDWLIKKAKSAIDKLTELPPWHPTDHDDNLEEADRSAESSEKMGLAAAAAEQSESAGYSFRLHTQLGADNPNNHSSFIAVAPPPSVDPDAIADTMKSFFPTSSTTNFQSYAPEVISRTTNNNHSTHEDLGLSLHSFQDHHGLIHGGDSQPPSDHTGRGRPSDDHNMFTTASTPLTPFESSFQRMVAWSSDAPIENSVSGGGGFAFMPPQQQQQDAVLLMGQGSSAAFAQRGTLQSSFAQSIRAWGDLPMASSADHHHGTQEIHQSLIFGSRFASGVTGFSNILARIHGQEEPTVVSDAPSSSSPNSQH